MSCFNLFEQEFNYHCKRLYASLKHHLQGTSTVALSLP